MAPIKGIRDLLKMLEAQVDLERGDKKTEGCVRELIRELRILKRHMSSSQHQCSEEFRSVYGEKSYILDYVIYLHMNLLTLCTEKFPIAGIDNDATEESDRVSVKMRYIILILVHLVNSLSSVRILIEKGLDVQAKLILRSYIEYSDLALAILGDETFYDNYRRMSRGEKESREVWEKFTRPRALTKILERIYIDMDGTREHWDRLQKLRMDLYGILSEYTHGHFTTVITGAFDERIQGGVSYTAFGVITKSINFTLMNAVACGHSFLRHAMIAIVQYQKLPFIKFGERGIKFVTYYKMLELFMPAFLLLWADETRSEEG